MLNEHKHSTFGRFDLRSTEIDGVKGWQVKALEFSEEELLNFTGPNRDLAKTKKMLIDIPKGFYELPSVVEGLPVISFNDCFENLSKQMRSKNVSLRVRSIDLTGVDLSNAIDCTEMFAKEAFSSTAERIELNWATAKNLKYASYMFRECITLKQVDLTGATLESLVNAACMFLRCRNLESLGNISALRLRNLETAELMFGDCPELAIDMDLTNARLDSLKSARLMFSGCCKLKSIHMSRIDHSIDLYGLVDMCESIEELDLSMLQVASRHELDRIVYKCCSLRELTLPKVEVYTIHDRGMSNDFCRDCTKLERVKFTGVFENTKVKPGLMKMFVGCHSLKEVDLRFLGDVDLKQLMIPLEHNLIVHCTYGAKTTEDMIVLGSGNGKLQQIIKRLNALEGEPSIIVVKHNDTLI